MEGPLDGHWAGRYNTIMPTTAIRKRPKKRRVRERSLATAMGWSAFVTLILGLTVFGVEVTIPGTPINNFWNLVVVNGQVSRDNPLINKFLSQARVEDLLIFSVLCVLGGGITLGRLAPTRRTRRATIAAAGGLAMSLLAIIFGVSLVFQLELQGGTMTPGQFPLPVVLRQLGWNLLWVLIYILGTLLGLRWRDSHSSSPAGHDNQGQPAATLGRSLR